MKKKWQACFEQFIEVVLVVVCVLLKFVIPVIGLFALLFALTTMATTAARANTTQSLMSAYAYVVAVLVFMLVLALYYTYDNLKSLRQFHRHTINALLSEIATLNKQLDKYHNCEARSEIERTKNGEKE